MNYTIVHDIGEVIPLSWTFSIYRHTDLMFCFRWITVDLSFRYSLSLQVLIWLVLPWIRYTCFLLRLFCVLGNIPHFFLDGSEYMCKCLELLQKHHRGKSFRILSSTISPFTLIRISISSPAGTFD